MIRIIEAADLRSVSTLKGLLYLYKALLLNLSRKTQQNDIAWIVPSRLASPQQSASGRITMTLL